MVRGIEKFSDFFKDCSDAYVILGGAACDEWFSQEQIEFRTTKDIDMVIILEARNQLFFQKIWNFLQQGGYENWQRSDGKKTFFRFLNPKDTCYPAMLEILARPEYVETPPKGQNIVRIHLEDNIPSLSAILLDDKYYQLILSNKTKIDPGLPLVTVPALILLKAKAYLNLLIMREQGKTVKSDDLKKHRNDVFRLAYILSPPDNFPLDETIKGDLKQFLNKFPDSSPEWQGIMDALRTSILPEMSPADLRQRITEFFFI